MRCPRSSDASTEAPATGYRPSAVVKAIAAPCMARSLSTEVNTVCHGCRLLIAGSPREAAAASLHPCGLWLGAQPHAPGSAVSPNRPAAGGGQQPGGAGFQHGPVVGARGAEVAWTVTISRWVPGRYRSGLGIEKKCPAHIWARAGLC